MISNYIFLKGQRYTDTSPLICELRLVIDQLKIIVFEIKNRCHIWICSSASQIRLAAQLQFHLFDVVIVDMGIAQSIDKNRPAELLSPAPPSWSAGHLPAILNGTPRKNNRRFAVSLARKFSVVYAKLAGMAWRKVHFDQFAHIPGAHNQTAHRGILPDIAISCG